MRSGLLAGAVIHRRQARIHRERYATLLLVGTLAESGNAAVGGVRLVTPATQELHDHRGWKGRGSEMSRRGPHPQGGVSSGIQLMLQQTPVKQILCCNGWQIRTSSQRTVPARM